MYVHGVVCHTLSDVISIHMALTLYTPCFRVMQRLIKHPPGSSRRKGRGQGTATTSGDPKQDRANAASLGNAVLVMTMLPWSLCVLTYTAVHFTYRRDKLRALALSQGEQQTVLVWAGSPGGSPGRSPVMPERDWRDGEGDVASDAALETVSMLGGSKLSHA